MKRMVLVLLLCAAGTGVRAQERDSLLVMFWNVENFFDWIDQGTGESDAEFSSYGSRHWTKSRFYAKCDVFAKALMWVGDKYGRMPDVIGLAEVENRGVLTKLLSSTLLRKFGYGLVHRDSRDRRGIDVAMLYRTSSLSLVGKTFRSPSYQGVSLATRDILHAAMKAPDGRTFDIIVNHHPSKFGGEKASMHKRTAVMQTLRNLCDSLTNAGGGRIVAMGDFNDTPDGPQFSLVSDVLENKGLPLHDAGKGSIRYKGKWELIDLFMTGPSVKTSEMQVVEIPFLMTYDRSYPGYKPLRTYSGPRYLGGVSDHCPILLWIE
ncbi:MAG: endonuclease [Bacteroidales bacterium]|nr:endonuclease [Bacteroidales bacterium]